MLVTSIRLLNSVRLRMTAVPPEIRTPWVVELVIVTALPFATTA